MIVASTIYLKYNFQVKTYLPNQYDPMANVFITKLKKELLKLTQF